MSLAELLIQKAGQGVDYSKQDVAGNIAKGAGLAMEAERIQQSRMQLEQQKKQVANQKMEKFVEAFQKGANYRGQAKSKYYKQVLPKYRDALGLTDTFSDDALEFMTSDDTSMARVQTIIAKVRNGQMSEEDAIATINDPVAMAGIDPDYKESLYKDVADASKTAINSETQRTVLAAQNARFQQSEQRQQDFRLRTDKQNLVAKREQWGLGDLENSVRDLDSKVIPGGIDKWNGEPIPGVAGADAKLPREKLDATGRKNRQYAQALANKLLKARSGGAVSEGEATRLLKEMGLTLAVGEGGGFKTLFTGTNTSADFVRGVKQVKDKLDSINGELRAAYGDEAFSSVVKPYTGTNRPKQETKPKLDDKQLNQMATGYAQKILRAYEGDYKKQTEAMTIVIEEFAKQHGISIDKAKKIFGRN